eukprot:COSAG04_NODE_3081_length_3189_cov_2.765372_2_plen_79_part_00
MVDAVDRGRFAEAKAELHGLCEIEDLRGVRLPPATWPARQRFGEGLGSAVVWSWLAVWLALVFCPLSRAPTHHSQPNP